MKKIVALLMALCMVFALCACGSNSNDSPAADSTKTDAAPAADAAAAAPDKTYELKFAYTLATDHEVSEAFEAFAAGVKEATNGAIEIEVYPSSQLGDVGASQEAIQMNTLDMAVTNLAVIGSVIPEFGAVGGPFLFESDEHIQKAMEARSVLRGTKPPKGPEHLRISVHRLPSLLHLQAHQYRG